MNIEGITDNLKLIRSMVFKYKFMPSSDEKENSIQSKKQAGEYFKIIKKRIQDGDILRYSMSYQIPILTCYNGLYDFINQNRKEIVDKLNEKYYGKEKYLKLKQCI